MKNWSLVFVLLATILTASTTASSSSNVISKEVMDNLDNLYKYSTDNNWQLQRYPQAKMIILLGKNEGYRVSLQNTVHNWEKFWKQVFYIIEQETSWSVKDVVASIGTLLTVKTVVDIGCTYFDSSPPCKFISKFYPSSSK